MNLDTGVRMLLHWSPRSPFVRKVMIVLHETGLISRVTLTRTVVAATKVPEVDLLRSNPTGKIPTLILADGTSLFDSRVICEYLDTLHDGEPLFPRDVARRFRQLRWMAMADGMTDVLLLWRTERLRRPDAQSEPILQNFEAKVRACLAAFESEIGILKSDALGIGHIALVCALGQMEFRFGNTGWRLAHPKLAHWFDTISTRPSIQATLVKDDGTGPPEPEWAKGPALMFT
jgi:glutathione S-transferase